MASLSTYHLGLWLGWRILLNLLLMFYNAVISSTISFGAVCCGGNVSKHDQGRMDEVVDRASRIVGRQINNFQSLYRGKVLHEASQLLQDPPHPIHVEFYSRLSHRCSRFLLHNIKTKPQQVFFYPLVFQFMCQL